MIVEYPPGATPLDPDEMDGLKYTHVTTRQELDHLELVNIEEGLIWLSKAKQIQFFSEAFIKILHKKLFGKVWGWAGHFRKTEKNIGVDPLQISTHIYNLLNDARYWFDKKTYDPVEAAVRFHHRLVFIHPFANGNGRHARIMANVLLKKVYKYAEIDWAKGHDLQTINNVRERYIAALREADKGNIKILLEFAKNKN